MLALVFSVILLLLSALIVSYPLLAEAVERYTPERAEPEAFTERDALLEALSDLELSWQGGKLSEQDYEAEKARLEGEYIRLVEGRTEQRL